MTVCALLVLSCAWLSSFVLQTFRTIMRLLVGKGGSDAEVVPKGSVVLVIHIV